jgi:hypothetical protein
VFCFSLDAEAVGQKSISSGGVNQKTGAPDMCGPNVKPHRDDGVFVAGKIAELD